MVAVLERRPLFKGGLHSLRCRNGDESWRFYQNPVLSAAIRVTALPKAMVNVISVADQGLMWAWRCWLGTRVTAKDATEQGYVLLAMEQGYVRLAGEPPRTL